MPEYELEKYVWSQDDFDRMGWHDCCIYSIAFFPFVFPDNPNDVDSYKPSELAIDLDYIFEWIDPEEGDVYFRYMISPSTLVFSNVYDIQIKSKNCEMIIDSITRDDERKRKNKKSIDWLWKITCHSGSICFRSEGFLQYTRKAPELCHNPWRELEKRGGISFNREVNI